MSKKTRRKSVALFDVDTQNDFIIPSGALYVRGSRMLGPNIRRLVACAQDLGLRAFADVDAHTPDDAEFEIWPPHCVVGTEGQQKFRGTVLPDHVTVPYQQRLSPKRIAEVLQHQQIIFEKQTYSVFDNPNTEPVLAASDVRRYIVFGLATDYCVRATVLGLCKKGYEVTMVTDAIRGIAPDTTEAALDEMRAAGAAFQTTRQVLAALNA
jgi:nicotinamidase/pyrazinamidase